MRALGWMSLALLAGCAPATLSTDRTSYAPGQRVELTLHNTSGETLRTNPCLYVWRHGLGRDVVVEPLPICADVVETVPAGGTDLSGFAIPAGFQEGQYRFSRDVWYADGAANPFSIKSGVVDIRP